MLKVGGSGNVVKRQSTKMTSHGRKERHYVRLDLLRKMHKTGELLADFMTELIRKELNGQKRFTDPKMAPIKCDVQ